MHLLGAQRLTQAKSALAISAADIEVGVHLFWGVMEDKPVDGTEIGRTAIREDAELGGELIIGVGDGGFFLCYHHSVEAIFENLLARS